MRAVLRDGKGFAFNPAFALPRAPKAGSNEVIVRVRAAAINPVDYKAPKAIMGKIVGLDVAGVVEVLAVGGASSLKVGDEVYGTGYGSLADRLLVDAGRLSLKPPRLSFAQAAAMPTAYITGLQGLRDYGALSAGGRVLVIGASGGCGTAAVQLARAMGAGEVVGVCSGKNGALVLQQGAHRVVDYTKASISEVYAAAADTEKFDVIFDAATNSGAGEDYKDAAVGLLRADPPGQYVAINGATSMWIRKFTIGQKANQHLLLTKMNTADLAHLATRVDGGRTKDEGVVGKLEPVIAAVLPFTPEDVERGFELLKSRRTVGKIVFDMGAGPRPGADGGGEPEPEPEPEPSLP